jgi:hypothetical protein
MHCRVGQIPSTSTVANFVKFLDPPIRVARLNRRKVYALEKFIAALGLRD